MSESGKLHILILNYNNSEKNIEYIRSVTDNRVFSNFAGLRGSIVPIMTAGFLLFAQVFVNKIIHNFIYIYIFYLMWNANIIIIS